MSQIIVCFVVSFVASLCADIVCVCLVAWLNDELQHLERTILDGD